MPAVNRPPVMGISRVLPLSLNIDTINTIKAITPAKSSHLAACA